MQAKLWFDGSSLGNPGPSSGAAVLEATLSNIPLQELTEAIGHATCNEAEYQGLIIGLHAAIKAGVKQIEIFGDSQLVINQVNGTYKVKNGRLKHLHHEVRLLLTHFEEYTLAWIPREQNKHADRLAGYCAQEQKVWK